jgi:hypothetical protein
VAIGGTLIPRVLPAVAAPREAAQTHRFDWSPLTLQEPLAEGINDTFGAGQAPTPAPENLSSTGDLKQEADQRSTAGLAKAAQTPIASLISLQIQWNATPSSQWAPLAIDPSARHNRGNKVWNVQPVVPIKVSDQLMLVSRIIVPVTHRPLAGKGGTRSTAC